MNKLPVGDHTPDNYTLPSVNSAEPVKKMVRRFIYPAWNLFTHHVISKRYYRSDFTPDLFLFGQRGNDYERHRRRVNRHIPLKGKDILIAGCGTGKDLESWLPYKPRYVTGVDWFDYDRAWQLWLRRFAETAPDVKVSFSQGDLSNLHSIPDANYDLIASDAVFEHLKNFSGILREFHRIIRPGGVLYATFGPLYYCWGGDHVSGYDDIKNGYNHLLLQPEKYQRYLDAKGPMSHDEHDGRTWIEHDLFSRLSPLQYLKNIENAGFQRIFVSAMISPRAVRCLKKFPELQHRLANTLPLFDKRDFVIEALSIIYVRR